MRGLVLRRGLLLAVLSGLSGCAGDRLAPSSGDDRPLASPGIRSSETGAPSDGPRTLYESEAGTVRAEKLEPFVEQGTGRLVGQPRPLPDAAVVRGESGDITLNVVDADIRDVVRLVLEDGLNANYVIDPAVSGSVTIRTGRPIPAGDVLPTLNSVLNMNGAALIEKGGLYQIVTREQAAAAGERPSTRLTLNAGGPASGILVTPLRYADAAELAEILQPFVANQGSVLVDADRNTLLLTGSADQIATMNDLIDIFDVDWMEGMSFGFYPLDAVQPSQLALELDEVFIRSGEDEEDAGGNLLRLVPIDRLNALLVITAQPAFLERVETWIQRLDKVGEGDEEQIYVYSVQNGRASDLASVLGELFDIRSTVVGEDALLAPDLEPLELRSSLPSSERDERGGEEASGSPDRRTPFERRSQTGFDATGSRELTGGEDDTTTRIVADEANNSLLVRAMPAEYRQIESALRELDRPPLQVLLEATIAEVTLRDELSYGIQWFFEFGSSDIALSARDSGVVEPFFPGFSGILSSGDVRVVIDALDSVSDVKVISSPQILVLDNQTAQLEVGDEVPIITRQSQGIDSVDGLLVTDVEQRQTGVILNVTPRVNASGLVVLDIQQEVSDVVQTTTSDINSPTIAQRRIGTSVAVGSGKTIALGGLIQDNVDEVQSGIPLLSAIPVVGYLFGRSSTRSERTELLVLITPKVLANQQEAVAATDELRRRLRAVEPLQAKIGNVYGERETAEAPHEPTPAETETRLPGSNASTSGDGRFVVQLASLSGSGDAEVTWANLEAAHRTTLKGLSPLIEPFDAGGRSGTRLLVGPFSTLKTADDLCDRLRAEGADCLVIDRT